MKHHNIFIVYLSHKALVGWNQWNIFHCFPSHTLMDINVYAFSPKVKEVSTIYHLQSASTPLKHSELPLTKQCNCQNYLPTYRHWTSTGTTPEDSCFAVT